MLNKVAYRPVQRTRVGGKAQCILNLSTRRIRVVDYTLQPLCPYGTASVPTGYEIRRSLVNTNCTRCTDDGKTTHYQFLSYAYF
jgi:hypothetical protein